MFKCSTGWTKLTVYFVIPDYIFNNVYGLLLFQKVILSAMNNLKCVLADACKPR